MFLAPGETIRPVRLDGDRRGYVIAVADTNLEALERAEAAAALLDVEVEAPVQVGREHADRLRLPPRHYEELLEAAQAGGYRFAGFDRDPEPGDLLLRHDVDLSLEAALRMARLEADAAHARRTS